MHVILQHELVHGDENYYCPHEIDTNKTARWPSWGRFKEAVEISSSNRKCRQKYGTKSKGNLGIYSMRAPLLTLKPAIVCRLLQHPLAGVFFLAFKLSAAEEPCKSLLTSAGGASRLHILNCAWRPVSWLIYLFLLNGDLAPKTLNLNPYLFLQCMDLVGFAGKKKSDESRDEKERKRRKG
jgi:hypothetical protein